MGGKKRIHKYVFFRTADSGWPQSGGLGDLGTLQVTCAADVRKYLANLSDLSVPFQETRPSLAHPMGGWWWPF